MMTFRVSEIAEFHRWQHDEEYEIEALLERMRGRSEATEAMLAGTAFHKALELASAADHEQVRALGYTFNIGGDFQLAIPPVREVRAGRGYYTPDGLITISGQLDNIDGKIITDYKTTSKFDPERYLDGWQWRYYLDIFNADRFVWEVFQIKRDEDAPADDVWDVFAHHRLEQWRYPELGEDCWRLAADLARFATEHMPERCRVAATA